MTTKDGVEITHEYERVKTLIDKKAPLVFVTGKAGTGKSTLIHYLRKNTRRKCVVLAPTGVAAMNVQGATIHSFFRFPPRMLTAADAREISWRAPYEDLELLIIDEVSMVRADVLDAIDRFLRLNGRDKRLPFGGVQLLLVGDLHQLPPVVSNQDERQHFESEYESPFFFSSRSFDELPICAVELTHIFRQKDDAFVDILNHIRVGAPASDVLGQLNARVTPHADPDRETVLTTKNAIADRTNKTHLARLPGDRRSYHGTVGGDFQITNDRYPSPLELMLKVDSRVLFTRNDPAERWVNGTLGVVEDMANGFVTVSLDGGDDVVEVEPVRWETYRYEYNEDEGRNVPVVSGSYEQLPLRPAWAITIHKSQGKTLSAVRVDLGRAAFAPGQVYVALSRCRRLEDLSLSRRINAKDVFCDPRVIAFYSSVLVGNASRAHD